MPDLLSTLVGRAAATAAVVVLLAAVPVGAKSSPGTHTTRAPRTPATHATSTKPARRTPKTPTPVTTTTVVTTTTTTTSTRTTTAAAKPKSHKAASHKPPPKQLVGTLGGGTTFPARALVLSVPGNQHITARQLNVTENGGPVSGLTLTPLSQAKQGDFGVVLLVDQSQSMSGAPLSAAMAAVRALAAQRSGQQELGLITFDSTANVALPLSSDPLMIAPALAVLPPTGVGTRILPALMLALNQLAAARVAAGAIILLSDGGDGERGTKLTPGSVAAAARSVGVPIFTVGFRDSQYSPSSLQTLAKATGGSLVASNGSQLPQVFTSIVAGLSRSYVVRYRSLQRPGSQVVTTAQIAGVPGTVKLSYVAPLPKKRAPVAKPAGRARHHQAALPPQPGYVAPQPSVNHSFWGSSNSVLLAAVAAALMIGLAIAILLWKYPNARAVRARVGIFTVEPSEGDTAQEAPSRSLSNFLERRRWWPDFVESVAVARMKRSPVELVKRAAAGAAFAGILLAVGSGILFLGLLPLLAFQRILRTVVTRAARKQRVKFTDELPSYLQDLAGAMRAGRSFIGAFSAVADTADEPFKSEFERVVTDEQLGGTIEESLEAIARRMQADDMGQVALIASLNRRSGSNVAEALDRVAEGARDRADMRRELKALTGQARMSTWVLTALPGVLLAGISIVAPGYERPMFHSVIGIALLVISTLMVFAGWKVMSRIVKVQA